MPSYNPGSAQMNCRMTYLQSRQSKTWTFDVNPKQSRWTVVVPTGSGAFLDCNTNFIALSVTDTIRRTGGQWFDWGFPLVPRDQLTSQVLIGWGFGCTNNNCKGKVDRSVVWLSPVADADIYIDYGNTGANQVKTSLKALQSTKIRDPTDNDMSGAMIFAVVPGSGKDGSPVDIAAAWGQDPTVSYYSQSLSFDLGTTVLPFTLVKVSKLVDKAVVSAGEEMTICYADLLQPTHIRQNFFCQTKFFLCQCGRCR